MTTRRLLATWVVLAVLMSATLVALTVAFELVVGRFVDQKSWTELARNYALWEGRLWPIVPGVLAAAPFMSGRTVAATAARDGKSADRGTVHS